MRISVRIDSKAAQAQLRRWGGEFREKVQKVVARGIASEAAELKQDVRGHVASITHRDSHGSVLASETYVRAQGGEPTRITYEDDSYVELGYDAALRLSSERYHDASGTLVRELTEIKFQSTDTGLLMLGGGVPKNFAQDIVVAAELLEAHQVGMACAQIKEQVGAGLVAIVRAVVDD